MPPFSKEVVQVAVIEGQTTIITFHVLAVIFLNRLESRDDNKVSSLLGVAAII